MPRFLFDVVNSTGHVYHDDEGLDLPSVDAAREHALREARGVMAQEPVGAVDYSHWEIWVSDESRRLLAKVNFSEACGGGSD